MMPSTTAESRALGAGESAQSAVSWAAALAGAAIAAALGLILLSLGTGLGFASISPWNGAGASSTAIGWAAALWLLAVQVISAGLGGYLVGRLRTRWVNAHTDEVFFRDTAHGLLVWALGTLISASVLSSAASALVGAGIHAAGASIAAVGHAGMDAAGHAAGQPGDASRNADPTAYVTDQLLRSDKPATNADDRPIRMELGRIVAASLANGDLAVSDKPYVVHVIATQTGLSEADAEHRLDDVVERAKATADQARIKARQAADATRKAAAYLSLWVFIALLSGAFAASVMAMFGGRLRDRDTLRV